MKTIRLSRGRCALVNDSDFIQLNKYKWCALKRNNGEFYAIRWSSIKGASRRSMILMHREIIGAKEHELVDHKNTNSLDNRRRNLRVCDKSQNACNRGAQINNNSGFKGVSWNKKYGFWEARIQLNGTRFFLGYFVASKKASVAYQKAAKNLHKEFARI